jgi:hypothetical protein
MSVGSSITATKFLQRNDLIASARLRTDALDFLASIVSIAAFYHERDELQKTARAKKPCGLPEIALKGRRIRLESPPAELFQITRPSSNAARQLRTIAGIFWHRQQS